MTPALARPKGLIIRDAASADEGDFRRLWAGFLQYYDLNLDPQVTDFTWKRLMDPACPMALRLALRDGQALGFALHQHHPSSWVMGDDGYLEDLFVEPEARGQGIGRALIEDLFAIARARGWCRVYWLTDQDNAAARGLYDQLAPQDNHIRYRRSLQP